MIPKARIPLIVALLCALLAAPAARAGTMVVNVVDRNGRALADAVVTAEPLSPGQTVNAATPGNAVIDQRGRLFRPWVVGIRVGDTVTFTNHDDITHHVYSFSDSKQFSFRLQASDMHEPIQLNRPGVVVIGCNIHDWMVGYIRVTESPYVSVTDERGLVELDGLVRGEWRIRVWHPGMQLRDEGPAKDAAVDGPETNVTLRIDRELQIRKPPEPIEGTAY